MSKRQSFRLSHSRLRAGLVAGSSLFAIAAPAFAQDADRTDDEILVTGTRIERPALSAPSPVTSIGAEDISRSGETNLTDLLNDVPSLVGSQDNGDATNLGIGTTGLQLLNLRNLGANRTLVLVNGRRHVGASGGTTAVDINTIPVDLIERVDVLTGGASAVYGADAVTGAVNFVLKDDFEGISFRGQGGLTPDHGDASRAFGSIVAGTNFAGGRGNITAAFEYSREKGVNGADRDFASTGLYSLVDNPDFVDGMGLPTQIFLQDVSIQFASPEGAVAIDFFDGFDLIFDFEGNGSPYDPGEPITFRNGVGGSATKVHELLSGSLTSDIERYVFNSYMHYDLTDSMKGFLEVKFAQVHSSSTGQPAFSDLIPILVNENPFVPDAIVQAANDAGVDTVFMSHDLFDLGLRGEDIRRRTYRIVGGLEGDIDFGSFENLTYNVSFTYGRLEERFFSPNNLVLDRFYAAMDAVIDPSTGQPTCRSNLDPSALPPQIPFPGGFGFLGYFDAFNTTVTPDNYGTTPFFTPGPNSGCEPLNLFGRGNASQAAIDFVNDDSLRVATVQQYVLTGYVSGDTSGVFELPAGPIGFALGGEWRKERSSDTPPAINTEGLTFGNQIFPTKGEYSVGEGFVEISVPVLADLPLVKHFSLDAAFRASNYSTVGYTQAWNLGGIYSPVEELRFRGTYSRSVRAPNITELFNPQNQSFFLPNDPCDIDNLNDGADPGLRAANCAAILTPLGVDPTTFEGDDILNATFPGVLGGNPDLSEERAKTWTIGAVWQPSFIDGLSLIIDYYNMTITDGIIFPASQDIVDQCVDLPSVDNQFCDLIQRRADGGLSFLEVIPVNVAFFETSGIDYEFGYAFDPEDIGLSGIGSFNLRYIGSYLQKLDVVSLPGQAVDIEKNESGTLLGDDAPTHSGALNLSWLFSPVTATYRWQFRNRVWRDEIDEFASAAAQGNILFEPMKTSRLSTHDIQVRYAVRENAEIYAGVNNLLDQEPDIGLTDTPIDAVGRFVYAGFTLQLN